MPLPDPLAAFRLAGRTALVTGARREIGRAIALGLAAVGARVAIHHAGTEQEEHDAANVLAELGGAGVECAAFAMDFLNPHAGTRLAQLALARFGQIDILVLNASIEIPQRFTEITAETFERQVAVNLRSNLELLQALVPRMAAHGWGRVVTIGSVQQVRPHPAMLVYAGTKAMQLNWVKNLAHEYGPRGVTVNNIAPGAIATARSADLRRDTQAANALLARIPVARFGTPDDLVGAALLLCSDAGSYINGANLYVDGGRTSSS